MTKKIKLAAQSLVDAIMEEHPSCVSADIHVERGIVTLSVSEKEALNILQIPGTPGLFKGEHADA